MNVASTLMAVLIIVLTPLDPILVVVGLATHSAPTDVLVKVCKSIIILHAKFCAAQPRNVKA